MANAAPKGSKQKKDAQPDRRIVQEALDNLLDKSQSHGGITFGHIWTILWHRNPAHTTWKLLAWVVATAVSVFGVGLAAGVKMGPVAATERAIEPSRLPMSNVLDAETSFLSHQAADWLYPLVQKLEGNSRTALQVTVQFQQATQGARVQLISPGAQPPAGFVFLVRKDGERECYEPLPRLKDENLQFIVDVPPPDRGDRLMFLTSAAGGGGKGDILLFRSETGTAGKEERNTDISHYSSPRFPCPSFEPSSKCQVGRRP